MQIAELVSNQFMTTVRFYIYYFIKRLPLLEWSLILGRALMFNGLGPGQACTVSDGFPRLRLGPYVYLVRLWYKDDFNKNNKGL